MFGDKIGKMFGKIGAGMCRLSINGEIAVKTDSGYKTYNFKTGRLTNCDQFVFDIGEEFFFVIPTNHVKEGDIILVDGKPRCVIEVDKKKITAINYENSTVDTILPEHHMLLGNSYMYGKIVSLFGNNFKNGKGSNNIFKYMMMSEMLKGGTGTNMNNMLPLMMMSGGSFENMFDGMFDFGFDDNEEEEDDE